MGLPIGERRKLRRVERAITRSDPRLKAMFSIFTRLSRIEAMPRRERVCARTIRRGHRVRQSVALWPRY